MKCLWSVLWVDHTVLLNTFLIFVTLAVPVIYLQCFKCVLVDHVSVKLLSKNVLLN